MVPGRLGRRGSVPRERERCDPSAAARIERAVETWLSGPAGRVFLLKIAGGAETWAESDEGID
ncbi:MAG: hypothetical protein ABFC38_00495 [Methanospirillum sp.]